MKRSGKKMSESQRKAEIRNMTREYGPNMMAHAMGFQKKLEEIKAKKQIQEEKPSSDGPLNPPLKFTPSKASVKMRGKLSNTARRKLYRDLTEAARALGIIKQKTQLANFAAVKGKLKVELYNNYQLQELSQLYVSKAKDLGELPNKQSDFEEVTFKDFCDFVYSVDFLNTVEWRYVRGQVIDKLGRKCCKCGFDDQSDKRLYHVDHVIPRRIDPLLAVDPNNLQVLCAECNKEKGNAIADYRSDEQKESLLMVMPPEMPSPNDRIRPKQYKSKQYNANHKEV